MEHVFNYIESNLDDSQFSINEIRDAVKVDLPDNKTIQRRIVEHYGENIIMTGTKGKQTIFCFVSTGQKILQEKWYSDRQSDEETERLRVVRAAANIVLEDIRSAVFETSFYPSPSYFLNDVSNDVPNTLKIFIKTIVTKYKNIPDNLDNKVTAIAHSIIAAARPRSFKSPLLLGIASLIHQKYASKTLLDLLSSIGFCASYKEVTKFELSAIFHPQNEREPEFKQFIFDNADFNTKTIDGLNTFHAMGGLQCNTPKDIDQDLPILRLNNVPSVALLGKYGNIPVQHYFNSGSRGLKKVIIKNYVDDTVTLPTLNDSLWLFGKREPFLNIPGWHTFMSEITKKKQYSTSEIKPLPFINAQPSDYDTVYTSLTEAAKKTRGLCIVTFDQPLYAKAQEIVYSDSKFKNVLVRLGGFHLLMSFMGAIGYIMSGSGLKELWCTGYAAISTEKMLTGHSYARAVRAHFLSRCALFNIIIKTIELSVEEELDIEETLNNYTDGNLQRFAPENNLFEKYHKQLAIALDKLEERGPTAKLWVSYFRMTTLIAHFIEAERSGNWELHILTIKKMLPYFHASGHFAYAKCCNLYLQDMENLQSRMSSQEYENFVSKGYFTIRRSDKFWSGIWSDQTIEQTLMRSMKSSGGLTHGRGVTDSVIAKWILATPILNTVSEKIEDYCKISYSHSDQHIDARDSRINRDNSDMFKFDQWFTEHEPFPTINNVVSLSTGVVGGKDINCYEALSIGQKGILMKVGQNYHDVSYSRKNRVLPLSTVNSSIKIQGSKVPIEPETIFRRICFTKKNQEELKSFFTYELAPYPLSLFDENGMRKNKKSILYELCTPVDENSFAETDSRLYVIDGGFLLHKVIWQKGLSISRICDIYIAYVKKHFNPNATVIFDGYGNQDTNTKTAERFRRSKGQASPDILFEKNTIITTTQEKFLDNETNKVRLIKYVKTEFEKSGISVKESNDDADTLIVHTAVENGTNYNLVFIIGNDVDLLVILCGSTDKNNIYLMKPGRAKIPTKYYSTESFSYDTVKEHILFIHAISGCDTTSAIFRQGKKKVANLFKIKPNIGELVSIFKNSDADPIALLESGETFLCLLYGENETSLNHIRYNNFVKSITKSKFNLACLPPSTEASKQHIYRTYHQVQKWLRNEKSPLDWGWMFVNNHLEPIRTLSEAAPKEILEMISCKCKAICKRNCTCQKAGMNCSVLCINCDGKVCHGVDLSDTDDDDLTMRTLTGCDEKGTPLDPGESIENREIIMINDDENSEVDGTDDIDNAHLPAAKKIKHRELI